MHDETAAAVSGAGSPAIECRGVSYTYGDGTQANQDIDLLVAPGELFCLLGANGAGKTTLIRQITTELTPTSGSIEILGRPAHANPADTKRHLGIIPQAVGLFDALTPEQHLHYFGPMKGLSRKQTKLASERVIEECDLGEIRSKKASALSGGQQRRLLVALAILADPRILVLDEPTVGLDPVIRRNVWETIDRQRAAGVTILLTTHYMDEAERLANRIGFIEGGRLTHVGTLRELYGQVGMSVRIACHDPETGETTQVRYFDTVDEAQDYARNEKLTHFAVGRASLEDIYLRLTGSPLEGDAG